MNDENAIVVGDRTDLVVNGSETYKTTVGDIADDGSLLVVMPSNGAEPVELGGGDELMLFFYRRSGRYGVKVQAAGFSTSDAKRLIRLIPVTEPQKEQRREFYRLPASLKTLVCQYSEDMPIPDASKADEAMEEIAYTNDISISGVSLRARQNYDIGERLLLKVYLGWPEEDSPPLDIYSEVRRVSPILDTDSYQAGFLFLRMLPESAETINKFVRVQQQKRIRQQRLIEED